MDNITSIGGGSAAKQEDPRVTQLRELRAKRKALEETRIERQEASDLDRALETEARGIKDEEALAAAIEQHGALGIELETIETTLGMIIVRRCGALRYRRFQDEEKNDVASMTAFALPCVIYPTRDEVEKWLDRQPGVLILIGQAIGRMAGMRSDLVSKK